MKIPLQDKIAELEARIIALEKGRIEFYMRQAKSECDAAWERTSLYRQINTTSLKGFGEHWSKMWDEFHLMMKDLFKP